MSSPLFAQMVIESQREWIMWWIVLCVVFQFSLSMSIALVCTWHLHASFGPSRKFSEEICEPLDEVEASFRKLLKTLIQITELISGSCTYILFDMKWRRGDRPQSIQKAAKMLKSRHLLNPNYLDQILCSTIFSVPNVHSMSSRSVTRQSLPKVANQRTKLCWPSQRRKKQ